MMNDCFWLHKDIDDVKKATIYTENLKYKPPRNVNTAEYYNNKGKKFAQQFVVVYDSKEFNKIYNSIKINRNTKLE